MERRLAALGDVDPARVALALVLAETLDDGAGLAVAAVSRELRATLSELEAGKDDNAEVSEFLRRVRRAEVGNSKIG